MGDTTDTFDAATVAIFRQALGNPPFDAAGPLSTTEAGQRLRRAQQLRRNLRQATFFGVSVVSIEEDRIVADIALSEKETQE